MGGARSDLPRVALRREDDEVLAALRALQCVALRRFAATDEGAAWSARLAGSALLQRARLALEVGTLWMLEDEPRGPLPSAYLDALFLAASGSELESLVDRVFEEMLDAER
jgi:hypothetical protein